MQWEGEEVRGRISPLCPVLFWSRNWTFPLLIQQSGMTTKPNPAWAFPSGWLQLVGRGADLQCVLPQHSSVQFPGTHIQPSIPRLQRGLSTSSSMAPKCPCKSGPFIPHSLSQYGKMLEKERFVHSLQVLKHDHLQTVLN